MPRGRALTPTTRLRNRSAAIRLVGIGHLLDGCRAFELLAGVRPYRIKSGLGAAGLAEAMGQIDAPLASKATTTDALRRQLRGDLDAILARAIAKASNERYATVDSLADDLQRHLRGEPVRARAARWPT